MSILSNVGLVPIVSQHSKRVPFVFTSLMRLMHAGLINIGDPGGSLSDKVSELSDPESLVDVVSEAATSVWDQGIVPAWNVIEAVPGAASDTWDYATKERQEGDMLHNHVIDGFTALYRDYVQGQHDARASAMPYIEMLVNPTSVAFQTPKRIVPVRVRNGTKFFHFTDIKGRNSDLLALSISGVTGNINLKSSTVGNEVRAAAKLRTWHELRELTREPMLFEHDGRVYENQVMIIAFTKIFPTGIVFIGHFNEELSFEESAHEPNMVQYRVGFTVRQTSPSLDDLMVTLSNDLAMLERSGIEVALRSVLESIGG